MSKLLNKVELFQPNGEQLSLASLSSDQLQLTLRARRGPHSGTWVLGPGTGVLGGGGGVWPVGETRTWGGVLVP